MINTSSAGRALPALSILAAALLLLLCFTPPATALSLPFLSKRSTPASTLIDWVREVGNVSVTVGPIPGRGGLRGMMADRAVAAGEVLVSLPSSLSVPMGTAEYTTPVRWREGRRAEVSALFRVALTSSRRRERTLSALSLFSHGRPPGPPTPCWTAPAHTRRR